MCEDYLRAFQHPYTSARISKCQLFVHRCDSHLHISWFLSHDLCCNKPVGCVHILQFAWCILFVSMTVLSAFIWMAWGFRTPLVRGTSKIKQREREKSSSHGGKTSPFPKLPCKCFLFFFFQVSPPHFPRSLSVPHPRSFVSKLVKQSARAANYVFKWKRLVNVALGREELIGRGWWNWN